MNWKERLLEAIVEQKTGAVHVKQGTETVTRRRVGPVTLRRGGTRTGMQSNPGGSDTPDDAQSERARQDRREFADDARDALRRGPVTETTTTKIVPTGRGGRRTTKTTRKGTGPYKTKHSERKAPRLRIFDK